MIGVVGRNREVEEQSGLEIMAQPCSFEVVKGKLCCWCSHLV